MLSDRLLQRIERLLDEAHEAVGRKDWGTVRENAQAVLALDPENADARAFLQASQGAASGELVQQVLGKDPGRRPESAAEVRTSLAGSDLSPAWEGPPAVTPDRAERGLEPGAPLLHAREGAGEARTQNPVYRQVFVGRDGELRQIESVFDAVLAGHGALAMVSGEPGVGKTALCEQLGTYVAVQGGQTLVGHCYEEGSLTLPYLPFVEALRSYVLGREPAQLGQELGSGATDVARIVSEVREKLAVESRAPGDPEDDRWRLYQSVTGFLRNAATARPLLVVLEDLHWADRGTLDLLAHLARNLQGARLLIVGTYRDVEVDRTHPLSGTLAELRRAGIFTRVSLRGLTPGEVHRMISSLQEQEILPSFAAAVHRQTEGNPLFVQEVTRYLVEEGLISRQTGRMEARDSHLGETLLDLRIPEGLRDVVGKRLSRLSAASNRLLSVAAVIGRDFSLGTLQQVAGLAEEPLIAALEEAVHVGILEEHTRPGQIRYRFAHAFFRQTLYEELLAPRRLRLHQQVARALEAEYHARPEEHAAELAEHYAQSTDRGDLEKALAFCKMAAECATAVYAYGEAARFLEQALGVQEVIDPDDQRTRCGLLLALATALCTAGEAQRVEEEVAEEAYRLADALGDSTAASAACRIALEAALRYGAMGALIRAATQHWAVRADRHAPPGSPSRVYADLALGRLIQEGDPRTVAEGLDRDRRALEAARALGDPRLIFECATLALPGRALGNWGEALRLAQEVAALPREGVSRWTTAIALSRCGNVFLACGQRDRAEDLWQEVSELAELTRDPSLVAHCAAHEIIFATLDGRLEAALQDTERFRMLADQAGSSLLGLHQGVAWSMRAHLYLGRAQEAMDGLRQSWGVARGRVGVRLGLGLAAAGQIDEAQTILDETIGPWRRSPPDAQALIAGVHPAALELSVLLEDRAAAAFLLPLLAPLASIISTQLDLTCVARHLGAAAALLGDIEGARDYYRQALEVCELVRFRPEIALIHLQQAELALDPALTPVLSQRERKQGRAEAVQHLDLAIAELRAMGMQPALGRALALQAGQRHRALGPPRPAYPAGLSEREVEVLRLVAGGKSNRDIADELIISLNTAAHHVSNIFRKIGAVNRADAASYATRHGLV